MNINSICIVGGGSSGWMTAALLSKKFSNIEITLIEPKINKPLGVGESTLGFFNNYLLTLGLEDKDWMKYCNATYKTSIAFKNFREGKGERFQYPFGGANKFGYNNSPGTFNFLQKLYPEYYPPEEFARYINFNTFLTESKKIIPNKVEELNYNPIFDTAYHFDADLFGQFLKEKIALPNKINYIQDEVIGYKKDIEGNIQQLETLDNNSIKTDLYIDCTGFKSLLLEKYMGIDFISFNKILPNDMALATRIPYKNKREQMETYTDCVAMSSGWIWNIPLWNRVGTGYVFSSKYISNKKAEIEFREYLSKRYTKEIAEKAQMKVINIKHGRHEKAWYKNVIGIGLSFGFLEPLESTGLLTTHENILQLYRILEKRNGLVTKMDIDSYNKTVVSEIEGLSYFIAAHYFLSSRQDTPYWKDATHNPYINSNESGYKGLLDNNGKDLWNRAEFEGVTGDHYIITGMGINDISEIDLIKEKIVGNEKYWEEIHQAYQINKKKLIKYLDQYPYHYDYLKEYIYNLDT